MCAHTQCCQKVFLVSVTWRRCASAPQLKSEHNSLGSHTSGLSASFLFVISLLSHPCIFLSFKFVQIFPSSFLSVFAPPLPPGIWINSPQSQMSWCSTPQWGNTNQSQQTLSHHKTHTVSSCNTKAVWTNQVTAAAVWTQTKKYVCFKKTDQNPEGTLLVSFPVSLSPPP